MRFTFLLLLLLSLNVFAEDQTFSYIDCHTNQTHSSTLRYRFQINGTSIRTVYRDVLDPIVRVEFQEEPSGNNGFYLASEEGGEARFMVCRRQGRIRNNLIPTRVHDSVRGTRTVYCEPDILNWIEGFPSNC